VACYLLESVYDKVYFFPSIFHPIGHPFHNIAAWICDVAHAVQTGLPLTDVYSLRKYGQASKHMVIDGTQFVSVAQINVCLCTACYL
jgi:hypothetical protein